MTHARRQVLGLVLLAAMAFLMTRLFADKTTTAPTPAVPEETQGR
ncbi:MAG: hypothetical protein AAFV53_40485 [Myxococcota bacterium]